MGHAGAHDSGSQQGNIHLLLDPSDSDISRLMILVRVEVADCVIPGSSIDEDRQRPLLFGAIARRIHGRDLRLEDRDPSAITVQLPLPAAREDMKTYRRHVRPSPRQTSVANLVTQPWLGNTSGGSDERRGGRQRSGTAPDESMLSCTRGRRPIPTDKQGAHVFAPALAHRLQGDGGPSTVALLDQNLRPYPTGETDHLSLDNLNRS